MTAPLPGSITVAPEDPASADARALMAELSAALERITGRSGAAGFRPDDVRVPRAAFVVARDASGAALGCGAIRPLRDDVAEVKRMYARPGTRGVGGAVLRYLEATARAFGYAETWLETGDANARAIAFYRRHGYARIPGFGRYAGRADAVCFAKRLDTGHDEAPARETSAPAPASAAR